MAFESGVAAETCVGRVGHEVGNFPHSGGYQAALDDRRAFMYTTFFGVCLCPWLASIIVARQNKRTIDNNESDVVSFHRRLLHHTACDWLKMSGPRT